MAEESFTGGRISLETYTHSTANAASTAAVSNHAHTGRYSARSSYLRGLLSIYTSQRDTHILVTESSIVKANTAVTKPKSASKIHWDGWQQATMYLKTFLWRAVANC